MCNTGAYITYVLYMQEYRCSTYVANACVIHVLHTFRHYINVWKGNMILTIVEHSVELSLGSCAFSVAIDQSAGQYLGRGQLAMGLHQMRNCFKEWST